MCCVIGAYFRTFRPFSMTMPRESSPTRRPWQSYTRRIYGLVDRTGFNARQDGRHVSESVCMEREQQGRTPSFHLKPVVEKEAVRRGDAFQPASFPIPYLAFFRVVFLHIQCGKLEPFPLFVICFEDRLLRTQPFLSRKQPQNLTKPILEPT